jgi:hypothetical protein
MILLQSLLELADATSQNLEFAHRDDVHISYGEETITETNLLELRRRNPMIMRLKTFSKKDESLNGADWEWHIIGLARAFRMRVQAKRIQKDGRLKIPHTIRSSNNQQIDALISNARMHNLRPVYCIYSSNMHRKIWKGVQLAGYFRSFECGCLLVSAHKVKGAMPNDLATIEAKCVPWHYLVDRRQYLGAVLNVSPNDDLTINFLAPGIPPEVFVPEDIAAPLDDFPTIDQLNVPEMPVASDEGIVEVVSPEYLRHRSDDEYRERGISKLVEIDVRAIPPRRSD